jgi:hypothetical protein
VEIFERFEPNKVQRNENQKLSKIHKLLLMVVQILNDQISKKGFTNLSSVDLGLLMHLIADHLVYCPKIKFPANLEHSSQSYCKSILSTKNLIRDALNCFIMVLESEKIETILDFESHQGSFLTIILAVNLTEDQACS